MKLKFWKKQSIIEQAETKQPVITYDDDDDDDDSDDDYILKINEGLRTKLNTIANAIPRQQGTMDSCDNSAFSIGQESNNNALMYWYASNSFIGYSMCAILSQHWLIYKACNIPAKDAIRNGYEIKAMAGKELSPEAINLMNDFDKSYNIKGIMLEYITFGRIFGIRLALFKVDNGLLNYYENPFNIDSVTPNSYKGIVQIDPQWCSPDMTGANISDPAKPDFMMPKYWMIAGKRYHHSHFVMFVPHPVSAMLRPSYVYGGVSIPQRIMERVYGAERVANEAPHIALSKRTTIFKTDQAKALTNENKFVSRMMQWIRYRDNFGIKVVGKSDEIQQFDTSLSDFDDLIMSQYQLVAAASNVPSTKLLGTSPKGFNSTGEGDEKNYHEECESLQSLDLSPLLERHHQLTMHSYVAPTLNIEPVNTYVDWEPMASLTSKEEAEIEEINSRTDKNYADSGAIDQYDIRNKLSTEKSGRYNGIPKAIPPQDPDSYLDTIVSEVINDESANNGAQTADTQ